MSMSEHPDRTDLDVETAKFGAMLARKGLTPDQLTTVMRDQVQPVLADAARLVEQGAGHRRHRVRDPVPDHRAGAAMTGLGRATTCQHQRDVDLITQRSLVRHRVSSANIFSATIFSDERKAACQVECGAASPWHDVELHPVDPAAAAAALEPYDPIGDGLRSFFDTVERMWDRIRRRPATRGDQERR
jgi:hypothetical protein